MGDGPPAHLLLATSGEGALVALAVGHLPLRERHLGGRDRGRGLLPAIDELVREAGLGPGDLSAVAVDVGPGSFTGVRLGVTVAKTLAWSSGVPAVGLSSLHLLAAGATGLEPDRPRIALRPAGRGRLYFQAFEGEAAARAAVPGEPAAWAEAAEVFERAAALGAALLGEDPTAVRALAPAGRPAPPVVGARVEAAALLALCRSALGAGLARSAHDLVPAYVQPSAPEQLRDGVR